MEFATVKGTPREVLSGSRLNYLRLLDLYGALLTVAQREICEKYYLYDLSLAEIAEEKGISKQAVSEALKKSRELLDFYEEKLHFERSDRAYTLAVSDMMTRVTSALASLKEEYPELSERIDEIAEMVAVGDVIDGDKED